MIDINYLLWLQGIREALPDFVTNVFVFLSDFAVGIGTILVPAIFFWCISKTIGTLIFMNFSLGQVVNQIIKNSVCAYRPWIRDVRIEPAAAAVPGATGYSFPSGHTITAGTVYGTLAYAYRKYKWAAVLLIVLVLLIAFSRNFLGVHTPQDVIVGLLESLFMLFISVKIMNMLKNHEKWDLWVLLAGCLLSILTLLFVEEKPYPMDFKDGVLLVDPEIMSYDVYQAVGIWMGFLLGWFIERRWIRFEIPAGVWRRVIRALIGVIGILIINILVKNAYQSLFEPKWYKLIYSFTGYFYFTAVYPFLFTVAGKVVNKK